MGQVLSQTNLTLAQLNVKEVFRLEITGINDLKDSQNEQCYLKTIGELLSVQSQMSPSQKLETIYLALSQTLPREAEEFHHNAPVQVRVDIDNLQGLCIYFMQRMAEATFLVDCFLITEFLGTTTKLTTKMLFLDVVKASIDFFLEMQIKSNDNKDEAKPLEICNAEDIIREGRESATIVERKQTVVLRGGQFLGTTRVRRRVTEISTSRFSLMPKEYSQSVVYIAPKKDPLPLPLDLPSEDLEVQTETKEKPRVSVIESDV